MKQTGKRISQGRKGVRQAQRARSPAAEAARDTPERSWPLTVALPGSHSIGRLQRAMGNQAFSRLLREDARDAVPAVQRQRRRRPTVAPEGPSLQLIRDEPDEEIRDIHNNFHRQIGYFHDRWANGLAAFLTTMQFSSAQEAEAKFDEAIAGAVAEGLLDLGISLVGQIPVVGQVTSAVLSIAKAAGKAAFEEAERSSRAGGERQIAVYVNRLRTAIQRSKEEMGNSHEANFERILDQYRAAASSSPDPQGGNGRPATVFGPAATWITRYRQAAETFAGNMPPESRFQQMITERFALTGEPVGYVTRGTFRGSGTLSISMEVRIDSRGQWHVEDIDDHWTLGTSAPNPERVAQNLLDSLGDFPILTHANLPKQISIEIENEQPGADIEETSVVLTMPIGRGELYVESRGDRSIGLAAARNPTVALRLLDVTDIEGSSD